MRTKVLLTVAVVAMLALGGAVMASNMGFKISIPLTAGQSKYVSLPNYCTLSDSTIESGTATAADLRNEIILAGGTSVSAYNYNGSIWQRWSGGGIGQVNFALASGTGYQVVSAAGVPSWIVVGSHNPGLGLSFTAGQSKYVSVPYHTTSTTAAYLRNEIIAAGGTSVSVYNYNGSIWQRWSGGGIGQVNFALAAGTAYQAVSATGCTWTPAHY